MSLNVLENFEKAHEIYVVFLKITPVQVNQNLVVVFITDTGSADVFYLLEDLCHPGYEVHCFIIDFCVRSSE